MADRAYWKCSLTFLLNCSILGTCFFLNVQFREMPRLAISAHCGSNSLSACLRVIFKPRCRYICFTCLVPSSTLFTFRFLIILTVLNIIFRDMVCRNLIPLVWMRSHHRVTFLYLSRIPLYKFDTMIGYTCWTLWCTILPWKCGTLVP